jgi:hypothetical protein
MAKTYSTKPIYYIIFRTEETISLPKRCPASKKCEALQQICITPLCVFLPAAYAGRYHWLWLEPLSFDFKSLTGHKAIIDQHNDRPSSDFFLFFPYPEHEFIIGCHHLQKSFLSIDDDGSAVSG